MHDVEAAEQCRLLDDLLVQVVGHPDLIRGWEQTKTHPGDLTMDRCQRQMVMPSQLDSVGDSEPLDSVDDLRDQMSGRQSFDLQLEVDALQRKDLLQQRHTLGGEPAVEPAARAERADIVQVPLMD